MLRPDANGIQVEFHCRLAGSVSLRTVAGMAIILALSAEFIIPVNKLHQRER
jgi:hypothetical protein